MNTDHPFVRLLVDLLRDETDSCVVAFEPLGEVATLNRGDAFTVEISGPGDGLVEISYDADGISIGAWSGASTVAWDRAGNRLKI